MKTLPSGRSLRRPARARAGGRPSRGFGLIDALIALTILAFGMLALTRFQTRLVGQASEAQERMTAVLQADELLSTVLVDTLNRDCYTIPPAGICGSAAAASVAEAWVTQVESVLPGTVTTENLLVGDRMTLTITWTGKESQETRTHRVITDVANPP